METNLPEDVHAITALTVYSRNYKPDQDAHAAAQKAIHQLEAFLICMKRLRDSVPKLYTVYNSYYEEYVTFRTEYLKTLMDNQVRSGLSQTKKFINLLASFAEYYVIMDVNTFVTFSSALLRDVTSLEAIANEVTDVYSVPYDTKLTAKAAEIEKRLHKRKTHATKKSRSNKLELPDCEDMKRAIEGLQEVTGPMAKNTKCCIRAISEAAYCVIIICKHMKHLLDLKYTGGQNENDIAFEIQVHFNMMVKPARDILNQCQQFQGVIPLIELSLENLERNNAPHNPVYETPYDEVKLDEESERTLNQMTIYNEAKSAEEFERASNQTTIYNEAKSAEESERVSNQTTPCDEAKLAEEPERASNQTDMACSGFQKIPNSGRKRKVGALSAVSRVVNVVGGAFNMVGGAFNTVSRFFNSFRGDSNSSVKDNGSQGENCSSANSGSKKDSRPYRESIKYNNDGKISNTELQE